MGDGLTSRRPKHMGEAARLKGNPSSSAQDNAVGYSDTTAGSPQEPGLSSRSSSRSSSSSRNPVSQEPAAVKPKRLVRIGGENATFSAAAGGRTSVSSDSDDSDDDDDDSDDDDESLLAACLVPGCGEILSQNDLDSHEDWHRELARRARANEADEADESDQTNESPYEKANEVKQEAAHDERIRRSRSVRRTESRSKPDSRLGHSSKGVAIHSDTMESGKRPEFQAYAEGNEVRIARSCSRSLSPDSQNYRLAQTSISISRAASRTQPFDQHIPPMRHASFNEEPGSRREQNDSREPQESRSRSQPRRSLSRRSQSRHGQSGQSQSRHSRPRHRRSDDDLQRSFADNYARSISAHYRDDIHDSHRDRRREQRERQRQHDRPHGRNANAGREYERERGRERDSERGRSRAAGATVTLAAVSSSHKPTRPSRLWTFISGLHPESKKLGAVLPRVERVDRRERGHDHGEKSNQHPRPPGAPDNTASNGPDAPKHAVKKHQRLGKEELGKYAHEDRMPDALAVYLKKEWGICHPGIIPAMRQLLEQSQTTRYAYLCDPCVKHVSRLPKEGGFCGYRNIQTMTSYIIGARFTGYEVFHDRLPSIFDIQDLIENAWDMGINAGGRIETGGVRLTRKYIGTPEALALFQSINIPCTVQAFNHRKLGRATEMLAQEVERYFQAGQHDPGLMVRCTTLPPIYLQHPGHSLTIVGIEKTKSGGTTLLVFDPMFKNGPPISQLVGRRRMDPKMADKLLKTYRRGPKYLNRFRAFEIMKLTPRAQDIGEHAMDAVAAT